MSRKSKRNKAFSLVELLVVITIIGILASFVGLKLFGVLGQGRQTKAKADIKQLGEALNLYKLKMHKYPNELRELTQGVPNDPLYKEGFIEAVPKDPWENDYIYQKQDSGFLLKSLGEDAAEGGEGEAADISNKDLQEKK